MVEGWVKQRLAGELGVHGAAKRAKVDHADVVQVGDQDPIALHKAMEPLRVAPRDQAAVDVVEHAEDLLRDITDVDDAVVVKQRQVRGGIAIEGWVGQGGIELRLGIDSRVVGLFDPHTDGCGKIAVKLLGLVAWGNLASY